MSRFKSLVAMLLALSMLLGVGAMPAMAEETRDDIVIALWEHALRRSGRVVFGQHGLPSDLRYVDCEDGRDRRV